MTLKKVKLKRPKVASLDLGLNADFAGDTVGQRVKSDPTTGMGILERSLEVDSTVAMLLGKAL